MKTLRVAPALLYRPPGRARTAIAFGVAILISCTAVVIAGLRSQTEVYPGAPKGEEFIIGVEETIAPDKDETPAPADMPPQLPTDDPIFIDDARAVPPSPTKKHLGRPISGDRNTGPVAAFGKAMTLFAPRPEYPYDARRQKVTGSGVALITVDPVSGSVINVSMVQSAGNRLLDDASIAGLSRWRFRPGTASRIRCPITFTLTGASY